jgi:hypothetical protein
MRIFLKIMPLMALLGMFAAPAGAQWLGPDDVVATPLSYGPIHPYRATLEAAFGAESNPARRAILAPCRRSLAGAT